MSENELSPFDLIRNVSYDKKILPDHMISGHKQTIANKNFSFYYDTILHANMMNQCYNITEEMNYDFYFNSIAKKKRFVKWPSGQKERKELINKIKIYFNCSDQEAELYHNNMTKEDIEHINNCDIKI